MRKQAMDGRWPSNPAGFKDIAEQFGEKAHALCIKILNLLEDKACPHIPKVLSHAHAHNKRAHACALGVSFSPFPSLFPLCLSASLSVSLTKSRTHTTNEHTHRHTRRRSQASLSFPQASLPVSLTSSRTHTTNAHTHRAHSPLLTTSGPTRDSAL